MSITIKVEPAQPLEVRERTYQLVVDNKLGEKPLVTARREQVEMKGDEIQRLLTNAIVTRRNFPDVAAETVEIPSQPGTKIPLGEVWVMISSVLDRWATEDKQPGEGGQQP